MMMLRTDWLYSSYFIDPPHITQFAPLSLGSRAFSSTVILIHDIMIRIFHLVLFLLRFRESLLFATATYGTKDEKGETGYKDDANQTVESESMKKTSGTSSRAAAATSPVNIIPNKFTKETWAIAATTPLFPRAAGSVLERQQVQRQAPYVHWTCFRQEPARSHDILQCCQEIYKVQESNSNLLCWKRDACLADKKGRSEFITYCSHHSVHLRHCDYHSSSSSSPYFAPQFTFVSAPEFSDLHWANNNKDSSSSSFRQLIAYSTPGVDKPQQQEQWYYDVHSPLQLALDPLSLFAAKDRKDDYIDEPTFTAKLTSTILSDEDHDEDKRSLLQKLRIELPSSSANAPAKDSKETKTKSWKVSLNIILFLPEGIELIRRDALSACTSSCTSQSCTIAMGERVISTTSSSWMFDQQSIQFLTIAVAMQEEDDDGNHQRCALSWTVHLMVPEDDNTLLPSPTIFNGTAADAVVVHDNDTADEISTMLKFRTSHAYALPMTMAMDEWGNEL
jgi:hypothetical protein